MTAPALIEAEKRVALAAVFWVKDQTCSMALAELEQAVEDLILARKDRKRPSVNRMGAAA